MMKWFKGTYDDGNIDTKLHVYFELSYLQHPDRYDAECVLGRNNSNLFS